MTRRTTHELRTQKFELQRLAAARWGNVGYFRTVGAAKRAASDEKGIQYRIIGDAEVKERWTAGVPPFDEEEHHHYAALKKRA